MSGGGRNAWATSDDYTAFALIVIIGGVGFGLYELWSNFHGTISQHFAIAADAQIRFYRPFTHSLDELDHTLAYADYDSVKLGQIWSVLGALGRPVRWPASILIALLAIPCFMFAAPSRFTRRFDLRGLIREQVESFPAIAAVADRELRLGRLDPTRLRPLDPALTPTEWIDRFARAPDGALDAARAREALMLQLGPLWSGAEKSAPIVRVLYAAFGLHLVGRRKQAQTLLASFSQSLRGAGGRGEAGPEEPLLVPSDIVSAADDVLRDAGLVPEAGAITRRHAYTTTALMALLDAARRRSGVLAPSSFLGVKLVDRSLWYALHSLGFSGDGPGQDVHPNARAEALGARAHWAAERLAGRPLFVAAIGLALEALARAAVPPKGSRS